VALHMVTLTGTYLDGEGSPLSGSLVFAPSAPLADSADSEEIRDANITVTLNSAGQFSAPLYATDSGSLAPSGWTWTVTEEIAGLSPYSWSFLLPYADGSTQDISTLSPVT
jgi:hypothetical protein